MFKHILLAVDLEHEGSWERSLPAAIDHAKAEDAMMHIMTVVPDFGTSLVGSYFPKGQEQKMLDDALNRLHKFVNDNVPADLKVQHIVGKGRAYSEILRVAEEIDCDLIVMESHRPEMKDYLLGPNAARVVRHANCSVLVVRP
jgi:nucleotide-binding universal stress UspA family protein